MGGYFPMMQILIASSSKGAGAGPLKACGQKGVAQPHARCGQALCGKGWMRTGLVECRAGERPRGSRRVFAQEGIQLVDIPSGLLHDFLQRRPTFKSLLRHRTEISIVGDEEGDYSPYRL